MSAYSQTQNTHTARRKAILLLEREVKSCLRGGRRSQLVVLLPRLSLFLFPPQRGAIVVMGPQALFFERDTTHVGTFGALTAACSMWCFFFLGEAAAVFLLEPVLLAAFALNSYTNNVPEEPRTVWAFDPR